ncbi:MAG TPA: carboxypeptidase regulatory-like domain-containing protein [Pyrinomonadaceae bacterium]|nr:carboxypeptidase regulatory-like domain-containing protein [Pyrinomonadaceae bacterium]
MSKSLRLCFVTLLIVACCAIGAMAQSQASTGQIVGTVKNPNGELVPGATVTVTNPATGLSRTINTNDQGGFSAVNLPSGEYTIDVEAQGFGKFTQAGYKVEVGSAITADITLSIQAVTGTVLVSAGSNVETTQVQTTTNINETSISQLPINGRRFQDFVLATPTAQIDPSRGQISLAGQRGINGNVQIDGADYNNPFFGGLRGGERSNQAFTIPQGAIKEFQVVATGYNAEFGRSTGGIVNAVTKSGTNDFHGGAFYVDRSTGLAAKNAFGQIAAPTQQQFGGSVGGPFPIPRFGEGGRNHYGGKDKSFFFVAYEQQKLLQSRAVLLNNLHIAGITSGTIAPGIDDALNFSLSKEGSYKQTNDAKVFLTRFDFNFSQKHQLNVRYNYSVNAALNAVTAGTSLTPTTNSALSNNGTEGDNSNTFVGQLTSFVNATTINEFRAQYSKENRPRLANEISPLIQASYGNFGTVNFLPTTESDYRVQLADNLTLLRGSHTWKVGGEYNFAKASQVFAFRQFGQFSFSGIASSSTSADQTIQILRILSAGGNTTTANANGNITGTIIDPTNRFDDTRVRYARNIGNGLLTLSSPQYAGYAQDSWRVRPNFTINFGLRYEAQIMPQPDTSNAAVTNAVLNATLPLGNVDPRVIRSQKNQWAPRGGFAWDPWNNGKGVIRGYAGIYFAATPVLTLAAPLNNFRTPFGDVTLTLPSSGLPTSLNTVYKQFKSIGVDLNSFPLGSLPILSIDQLNAILANISAAGGTAPNVLNGLQVIAADRLKNPRSIQFGGGFEREIARGLTVGASYDYVKTTRLNFNRDYDLPTPVLRAGDRSLRPFFGIVASTIGTPAVPLIGAQNRPITAFGNTGFVQVRDDQARSKYQAFVVRAQFRRKFGQFDAFYTLSKNLDNDSTERNASFASYDNAFNLGPEYNYGANDRRHVVAFSSVLNLPLGFEMAMTSRYLSGSPIDITVSSIVAPPAGSGLPGAGLSAAAYAALVRLQGNSSSDLNQDAGNFNDRPYLAPGISLKRNAYRNRSLRFFDLRLERKFKLGEKFELSPSFEAFNLFNFKNLVYGSTTAFNYGNPGVNENTGEVLAPSNAAFLQLRDATGALRNTNFAGAPRQIQLGLRLKF